MKKVFLPFFAAAALSAQAVDLEFLEKLVAVPSVSADITEVNRATRMTRDYLVKHGIHCTVETAEDGREVLYAATSPGKKHDFVLSVHLDVVPPGRPGQFTMKRDGDRIVGRGTRDCKGNVVAVTGALRELAGRNVSVGCVFGPDEEIGGAATRWMVEKKGYVPGKMVMVVDASYDRICYAHKGQTFIRLKASGRSGHSARPWDCDDSITKVMQAYVGIRGIWDRRHPLPEDKWSDVLVPTYVKSDSGALNLIPSEMELVLNLRSVNPGAKDELVALAKSVSDCDVEVMRHSPPVNSDPDHPLIRELQGFMSGSRGKRVPLDRMLAATDARWFAGCGVPIVLIGVDGGDVHGPDEYATVSSIARIKTELAGFLLKAAAVK